MNKYGHKGWITFWHRDDVSSCLELQYNESTQKYMLVRYSYATGRSCESRATKYADLTPAQQAAFDATFTLEPKDGQG